MANEHYIINDVMYYNIDTPQVQEEGQLVSKIFNSHCM